MRVPWSCSGAVPWGSPEPPSIERRRTMGPLGLSAGVSGVMATPESTMHTA